MSICGCCELPGGFTPLGIYNRPNLGALAYRIGTFSTFRRSIIQQIQSPIEIDGVAIRPLISFSSRDTTDYGIAVIDMWSYMADILTFYQERAVNEAYLRTALQRESVQYLAGLLDYRPAPGGAAVALLAFTLEPSRKLQIPVGLRVQSVPGPGEKPQKFETEEELAAEFPLNALPLLPEPVPYNALNAGNTRAILTSAPPAPASNLVAFTEGAAGADDKELVSVDRIKGRTEIVWSPAMNATKTSMWAWKRKIRIFGAQAPPQFIASTPAATGVLKFQTAVTNFNATGSKLFLDGVFDDLKVGQRILLSTSGFCTLRQITAVAQEQKTIGDPALPAGAVPQGVTATVTTVTVDGAAPSFDIRGAVVYELQGDALQFAPIRFDDHIAVATPVLFVDAAAASSLTKGRRLIVDDSANQPVSVTITGTGTSGTLKTLNIDPALSRVLDARTAFAWANVARSTHGESVKDEIVGSGDASSPFQTFPLAKSPVTFVPSAGAPNGVASTLRLRANAILWKETDSFFGQAPDARVYISRRDAKEVMSVTGGDGQTGARFPTGRANIVADYRFGIGKAGNVAAGSIRNPATRPVGLKGVVNPLPADGGADPETLDQARDNAPPTVRIFGRIVSLRDFEDAARAFTGVARARADWKWSGEEQAVFLTVAGDDGAVLSQERIKDLTADLNSRRDPNRKMVVGSHTPVPIEVQAAILVDPAFTPDLVKEAVRAALADFFAFANQDLGRPVHSSQIIGAIQIVPGVVAADVNVLRFKDAATRFSHAAPLSLENHLPIFPNEIADVADPFADIAVTVGLT